jgi:3-oxoacid CoA-transferase subunit A
MRESRIFKGKDGIESKYIMEKSITGDIAIIKGILLFTIAWKADTYGNCVFKGTAQNFNPEV